MNLQVPAAQIFDLPLGAAEFPSPQLTKNFKFPDCARGIVPPAISLPRIVAMLHDDAGYVAARSLISKLPKHSRVGIELDQGALYSNEAREFYSRTTLSFSSLRVFAEKLGHEVIVLEPTATCFDRESRRMNRRISDLVQQSQALTRGSPEWRKAVSERLTLLDKQVRKSASDLPIKSAWRSLLMARKIARLAGWKESDFVFVGSAHAINLANIFDCKVEKFIGNYGTVEVLKSELRKVMAGQVELDSLLTARRARQRLYFVMRHPISFWRNNANARQKIY